MCTLTIVPTASGYVAGMNRDELRTRPPALPGVYEGSVEETRFISPREASGGTWIACSDRGDMLALLNWNLPALDSPQAPLISRGTIIPQLIGAFDSEHSLQMLEQLPLTSYAPFRLIATFREDNLISESRWDGRANTRQFLPWRREHWFSSSISDELAAQERGRTCESAAKQWPPSQSWIRRLHRSHAPQAGAFSVCVHREDAATVSYTEVSVNASSLTVSYLNGNPCQKEEFDSKRTLTLRRRAMAAAAG